MTDKQNGWQYVVARFCYAVYGGIMDIMAIVILGVVMFVVFLALAQI